MRRHPDLWLPVVRHRKVDDGALEAEVLAVEVDGTVRIEAAPDDLERLLQSTDGAREVEAVGLGAQPLTGADAKDGRALAEVGQGERRLGEDDRVAADRLR